MTTSTTTSTTTTDLTFRIVYEWKGREVVTFLTGIDKVSVGMEASRRSRELAGMPKSSLTVVHCIHVPGGVDHRDFYGCPK